MSAFSLRYYEPSLALRDWISVYYFFECDLPEMRDTLRAELPQIRFTWTGDVVASLRNLPPVAVPRASLCGPSYAAIRFHAIGPLRMFGCGLLPAGWAALIGAGASEFADVPLDLEEVVGPRTRLALEELATAPGDAERVAAADAFFIALAMRARQPPLWFTRVADSWLVGSTNPDVNQLVRALGMSTRQVERLALRIYGASPKLLARKSRAIQSAVRLGRHPESGWQEAAAGAYYDQPHFIRDFKTFIGMTPGEYSRRAASSLIRVTVDER